VYTVKEAAQMSPSVQRDGNNNRLFDEEANRHVAHLEEKTALYQTILEGRSPDTTNPANWDRVRHMHGDAFYSLAAEDRLTAAWS